MAKQQTQAKRRLHLDESFKASMENCVVENVQSEVIVASSCEVQSTSDTFKTPKQQRKRSYSNKHTEDLGSPSTSDQSPRSAGKTWQRQDNSLSALTLRFMDMLNASIDQTINLNDAAAQMHVQKRRIYDITNVLEGVDLVEKVGKNSVRWKRQDMVGPNSQQECDNLEADVCRLRNQEAEMDKLLSQLEHFFNAEQEAEHNKQYAFLLEEDFRKISDITNSTLLVIKAPTGTTLESYDPAVTGKYQLYVKSDTGPIICSTICSNSQQDSMEKTNNMMAQEQQHQVKSSNIGMEDRYLSNPMNLEHGSQDGLSQANKNDMMNSSVSNAGGMTVLEPYDVLSDQDYRYCLHSQEGLMELFHPAFDALIHGESHGDLPASSTTLDFQTLSSTETLPPMYPSF